MKSIYHCLSRAHHFFNGFCDFFFQKNISLFFNVPDVLFVVPLFLFCYCRSVLPGTHHLTGQNLLCVWTSSSLMVNQNKGYFQQNLGFPSFCIYFFPLMKENCKTCNYLLLRHVFDSLRTDLPPVMSPIPCL